jgi:hypothetical protein
MRKSCGPCYSLYGWFTETVRTERCTQKPDIHNGTWNRGCDLMKKNKAWYVKEWNEREETIHTEFPTYESAKKYFDNMIILTIKELRNDGLKPNEINEYLDSIRVTDNLVADFYGGMYLGYGIYHG